MLAGQAGSRKANLMLAETLEAAAKSFLPAPQNLIC